MSLSGFNQLFTSICNFNNNNEVRESVIAHSIQSKTSTKSSSSASTSTSFFSNLFESEQLIASKQINLTSTSTVSSTTLSTSTYTATTSLGFSKNSQSIFVNNLQDCVIFSKDKGELTITNVLLSIDGLQQYSPVKSLIFDLKSQNVEDLKAITLSKMLNFFADNNLKKLSLNFSQNTIGDRGLYEIIISLPQFTSLEKFIFNAEFTNVGDYSMRLLADHVRYLENLQEITIDVACSKVTDEGIKHFNQVFNKSGVILGINAVTSNTNLSSSSYSSEIPSADQVEKKKDQKKTKEEEKQAERLSRLVNNNPDISSFNPSYSSQGFGAIFNNGNSQIETPSINQEKINNNNNQNLNSNSNNSNNNKINPFNFAQAQGQMLAAASSSTSSSSFNLNTHSGDNGQTNKKTLFSKGNNNDDSGDTSVIDKKRKSPQELQAEMSFEQDYGKGFKILQSFGYKVGTGLGKNNEGIVEPVRATNKNKFHDTQKAAVGEKSYFQNLMQNTNTKSNIAVKNLVKFEKKSTMIVGKEIEGDDDRGTEPSIPEAESPLNNNNNNNNSNNNSKSANNNNDNKNTVIFNTVVHVNVNNSTQKAQFNQNNQQINILSNAKESQKADSTHTTPSPATTTASSSGFSGSQIFNSNEKMGILNNSSSTTNNINNPLTASSPSIVTNGNITNTIIRPSMVTVGDVLNASSEQKNNFSDQRVSEADSINPNKFSVAYSNPAQNPFQAALQLTQPPQITQFNNFNNPFQQQQQFYANNPMFQYMAQNKLK